MFADCASERLFNIMAAEAIVALLLCLGFATGLIGRRR